MVLKRGEGTEGLEGGVVVLRREGDRALVAPTEGAAEFAREALPDVGDAAARAALRGVGFRGAESGRADGLSGTFEPAGEEAPEGEDVEVKAHACHRNVIAAVGTNAGLAPDRNARLPQA
jgi:hypothetical protein